MHKSQLLLFAQVPQKALQQVQASSVDGSPAGSSVDGSPAGSSVDGSPEGSSVDGSVARLQSLSPQA